MAKKMTKKEEEKATKKKPAAKKSTPIKEEKVKKTDTKKAVKEDVEKPKKSPTKAAAKTKKNKKKEEDEIILTGKITVKIPKKNSDPYIISTLNGAPIKGYSPKDLEEFKEILTKRRDEIIDQLQLLKEQMHDPNTGEYVNENSPYSLHMAEQGTDSQEREKLFLWAQRESKLLIYTEDALTRIELGTYGLCVDCIENPQKLCPTCPLVPKDRLRAVPHTQHCVQVKQTKQN